jgi:hypothetical protein
VLSNVRMVLHGETMRELWHPRWPAVLLCQEQF